MLNWIRELTPDQIKSWKEFVSAVGAFVALVAMAGFLTYVMAMSIMRRDDDDHEAKAAMKGLWEAIAKDLNQSVENEKAVADYMKMVAESSTADARAIEKLANEVERIRMAMERSNP